MKKYKFSLIIHEEPSVDRLIEIGEALGEHGSNDVEISGHQDGIEIEFNRSANSFDVAIDRAIQEAKRAALKISKIEIDHPELATG